MSSDVIDARASLQRLKNGIRKMGNFDGYTDDKIIENLVKAVENANTKDSTSISGSILEQDGHSRLPGLRPEHGDDGGHVCPCCGRRLSKDIKSCRTCSMDPNRSVYFRRLKLPKGTRGFAVNVTRNDRHSSTGYLTESGPQPCEPKDVRHVIHLVIAATGTNHIVAACDAEGDVKGKLADKIWIFPDLDEGRGLAFVVRGGKPVEVPVASPSDTFATERVFKRACAAIVKGPTEPRARS
jgi:hypothetical protein